MIELKDVTKIYNKKERQTAALDAASLKIEKGEMVAVMGASGSGKTTLLNMIGCMDVMDEGEYWFEDVAVHKLRGRSLDRFRREHIGFVFQQFALLMDYTVLENVEIPLRAVNMVKKKRREVALEWLCKVGMEAYADKYPTKLSGGQQQRCAIARALVSGTPVILADEPTGALDSKTGQEIIGLLKELNEMGKTVIIVTHDERVAVQCGRVIRIMDGKIESGEESGN